MCSSKGQDQFCCVLGEQPGVTERKIERKYSSFLWQSVVLFIYLLQSNESSNIFTVNSNNHGMPKYPIQGRIYLCLQYILTQKKCYLLEECWAKDGLVFFTQSWLHVSRQIKCLSVVPLCLPRRPVYACLWNIMKYSRKKKIFNSYRFLQLPVLSVGTTILKDLWHWGLPKTLKGRVNFILIRLRTETDS